MSKIRKVWDMVGNLLDATHLMAIVAVFGRSVIDTPPKWVSTNDEDVSSCFALQHNRLLHYSRLNVNWTSNYLYYFIRFNLNETEDLINGNALLRKTRIKFYCTTDAVEVVDVTPSGIFVKALCYPKLIAHPEIPVLHDQSISFAYAISERGGWLRVYVDDLKQAYVDAPNHVPRSSRRTTRSARAELDCCPFLLVDDLLVNLINQTQERVDHESK